MAPFFLSDFVDKKIRRKANQASFQNKELFIVLFLRVILGIRHLSRFVDSIESNIGIWQAFGFSKALKNTKPLSEFLLKFAFPIAKWLFLQIILEARAHGLVFGKSVAIDCCFFHVYGKT